MVGFEDADAQQSAWETFGNHPEWKELRLKPYFENTVSNITNLVLRPTVSSQI